MEKTRQIRFMLPENTLIWLSYAHILYEVAPYPDERR